MRASQVPQLLSGVRHLSTGAQIYDVVIIGGGMVGMSLAAALGTLQLASSPRTHGRIQRTQCARPGAGTSKHTSSLRVAVIDRAPVRDVLEQDCRAPPDYRVSTVVESSIRFFEQAGAWRHMSPLAREFSSMQVWDTVGHGCLRWEGNDLGKDRMGAVVENAVIQSACYRAAKQCANVDFMCPGSITDVVFPPYAHKPSSTTPPPPPTSSPLQFGSLAEITIDHSSATPAPAATPPGVPRTPSAGAGAGSGSTIQARLVVAADGARSRTRDRAGLRTVSHAYDQRGVVATVATEPHSTAWQCFLPTGPIALLPTRDGFSNIVWSTTPQHAARLEKMSPDEFGAAVGEALSLGARARDGAAAAGGLGQLLSRVSAQAGGGRPVRTPPEVHCWVGQRPASFPLVMQHAGRYVRPRLALIGDAAHAVHPLAGQGVNLGFGDAAALHAALAATVAVGGDIGDLRILQDEYERPRMAINAGMSAALHALQGIFSVEGGPVAEVRSAGLALVNAAAPLRNELMRVAMGDAPALPADALATLRSLYPAPAAQR